jgi:hypothetical protein
MKNCYCMMGNRSIDLIRLLSLVKSIRDSGSTIPVVFLYFNNSIPNINDDKYKNLFEQLNITILPVINPIDLKLINSEWYLETIKDKEWDFIKLIPWSLDYDSILFMDTDMLVLQNIDELFNHTYDLIYTDGRISPLNSGLFILKPDLKVYDQLQQFIYNHDFTYQLINGWYNMGRSKKHYAIEVCQGILYYFFVKNDQFKTLYIDRKIYNNMSQQCYNNLKEDEIKIVHFTSWGKPFPNQTINCHHPFQSKIHSMWRNNLIDLNLL